MVESVPRTFLGAPLVFPANEVSWEDPTARENSLPSSPNSEPVDVSSRQYEDGKGMNLEELLEYVLEKVRDFEAERKLLEDAVQRCDEYDEEGTITEEFRERVRNLKADFKIVDDAIQRCKEFEDSQADLNLGVELEYVHWKVENLLPAIKYLRTILDPPVTQDSASDSQTLLDGFPRHGSSRNFQDRLPRYGPRGVHEIRGGRDLPTIHARVPTLSEAANLIRRLRRAEDELLRREEFCRICNHTFRYGGAEVCLNMLMIRETS